MAAIARNENFTQVVVWPGTIVLPEQIDMFIGWLSYVFHTRVQYLESIITKPDFGDSGPNAGGREDVIFAVHQDDIRGFAIQRLDAGMHWVEDVLDNEHRRNIEQGIADPFYSIYPDHVKEYRTW